MSSLGLTPLSDSDWLAQLNAMLALIDSATLTTPPASDAEAQAKSVTNKAVTPGNLAALGSSTSFAGFVELATSAEAETGTDTARAITPKALADALALNAPISGTHTVSAGEGTAGTVDIDSGKATATVMIVQIYRSGVPVFSDQAVSMAAGVITVASGSATYALTSGDVINWIVF